MNFLAYFYQLRASLRKFFNSNKAIATSQTKTKYSLGVNEENKHDLRQKCKKAALEVHYIRSFTHWPIAKAKVKTQHNSLVYLDVNRGKRASLEQRNKRVIHTADLEKKPTFTNKVTSVKKTPNS